MDLGKELAVEPISNQNDLHFRAKVLPRRMGNAAEIAYGGFALGSGVYAACISKIPDDFRLYTAHAIYLGPTALDSLLEFKVEVVRSTRTYQTRRVDVLQKQKGTVRQVMIITCDFQVIEPAFMEYSAPPLYNYTPLDQCETMDQAINSQVASGKATAKLAKIFQTVFPLFDLAFDARPPPESLGAQNMLGINKKAKTSQDDLPLHRKTNCNWVKSKSKLTTHAEQVSVVAFYQDGALAFLPLTFTSRFFDDAGAVSSSEAALRFFTNDLNFNQWHMQEQTTIAGGSGRTFSQGNLYDSAGRLVAQMSQQSIMRPPRPKTKL